MNITGTFSDVLNFTFAASGLGLAGLGLTSKLADSGLGLRVLVRIELLGAAAGHEGMMSAAPDIFYRAGLQEHGCREMFFVVRASNLGLRTTEITGWSILTSKGWEYSLDEYRLNPKLPYRLEPGSTAEFYVPMEQVFAAVQGAAPLRGLVRGIRGAVRLKPGRTRRSKMHKLPDFSPIESEDESQLSPG